MTPSRRVAALLLALPVVATLGACTEGSGAPAAAEPSASSRHEPEHEAETPTEAAGWNDADAAFLERMIPHHQQALELVQLAETRAESPAVRALAERIGVAQAPEILVMADWLVDHGRELPQHEHDHEMPDMPGMLTADRLAGLAEARGAAFDELFLSAMTEHHQGAVVMAEELLAQGENVLVNELATDVMVTQQAEIDRMAALLG